jgi:tRNA modification GTPase
MIELDTTIVALSSGKENSAIAIIRISGKDAFKIFEKCLEEDQKEKFIKNPPKKIFLIKFLSPTSKSIIDEVNIIKYCSPNSYTGEDLIEIFCHGGRFIIEKIIESLISCGAVPAKRGEFTKRAFLNGKIDLIKAEAICDLIESKTEKEYEAALLNYQGNYKEKFLKWKETITKQLTNIEANIEFPEEDDIIEKKEINLKILQEEIDKIEEEIKKELKLREKYEIIEKGINIPIIGIPNAGKSSLFNLLLDTDRAIVHHEKGTTRDVISEEILLFGERIKLLDTAGIREPDNQIEQIGIKKTYKEILKAFAILFVTPADIKDFTNEEFDILKQNDKITCIISKTDLSEAKEKIKILEKDGIPYIKTCLKQKSEREKIINFIKLTIGKKISNVEFPLIFRTKRQEFIAKKILENIFLIKQNINTGEEIISYYLKNILTDLSEYVGETSSEEILDKIFSQFCIGK